MDATRFDPLIRSLSDSSSRRAALGLGIGGALTTLGLSDGEARKGKRRKKLKKNAFGCVNVGGKCRGRDNVCCSGRCKGKGPKKGKKDTSRCVDHDAGGCLPGPDICDEGVACTTSAGNPGACATTTGHAGYCADEFPGIVQLCRRDAECQAALGSSAACVYCPSNETAQCVGIQAN